MKRNHKIGKKSILVIGDMMLDTYYNGNVSRISPEAPVPVFLKHDERYVLGGAANVAANLVDAGQNVFISSIIGNDDAGQQLMTLLKEKGINYNLVKITERQTTIKTRFLADNRQQVLRLDVEDKKPLDKELGNEILCDLEREVRCFDLIIISDYLKGMLTPTFTQGVIHLGERYNIPVIIDVKDTNIKKYQGAFLLKPNLTEIRNLTGLPAQTDDEIIEAAKYLREISDCQYVLCTCGGRGMVLVGKHQVPLFIKAENREVFDVSGAGDTTIAYLAVGLVNGMEITDAVSMSNIAAGIQVGKIGTSSVSLSEVQNYIKREKGELSKKILDFCDIPSLRKQYAGQKIVFTNGCFDILHIGHLRYLQKASTYGDILVVGVNSDDSVRRLKGNDRPINNENDRVEMLCALEFVDYVVVFNEDTPYELIKSIQPNVLVKGGDYKIEEVVGRDIVAARGGEVKLVDFIAGRSTTNIIKKIKQDNEQRADYHSKD